MKQRNAALIDAYEQALRASDLQLLRSPLQSCIEARTFVQTSP